MPLNLFNDFKLNKFIIKSEISESHVKGIGRVKRLVE